VLTIFTAGKINLCSPDHVSLLVHRTFNVSIPRHHIPTETWEFEYGPAENDPEFGFKDEGLDEDGGDRGVIDHSTGGQWIHRVTGEILGGGKGLLQFTVIGYAQFSSPLEGIANAMSFGKSDSS